MATGSKKPAPPLAAARPPLAAAPVSLAVAPVALALQPIAAPIAAAPAASSGEFPGALRASVEKTLDQNRAAYAKAKVVADESAAALQTSYAAARAGVAAINAKAFETLRANVEANFDFLKSSFAAASLTDYVQLQGEFARKQLDVAADQVKEIGALAQKTALDAVQPIKAQVAKTFSLSH